MNDGITAMILQWCLLCVIWMGILDRPLRRIGLHRMTALAILTISMTCTYVNWKLYFLPIEVNISGFLFPLVVAGLTWRFITTRQKIHIIMSTILSATLLCFLRKMLFWDPVLLIFDERILFPVLAVVIFHFLSRNLLYHWFMILLALPIADTFYSLSFLEQSDQCVVGSRDGQDLFWLTFFVWGMVSTMWYFVQRTVLSVGSRLAGFLRLKIKSK